MKATTNGFWVVTRFGEPVALFPSKEAAIRFARVLGVSAEKVAFVELWDALSVEVGRDA